MILIYNTPGVFISSLSSGTSGVTFLDFGCVGWVSSWDTSAVPSALIFSSFLGGLDECLINLQITHILHSLKEQFFRFLSKLANPWQV